MMYISHQNVTNRNEVIVTQPSLYPSSHLEKMPNNDESDRRICQLTMSKKSYIYRGNVFLPGGDVATSTLHFSSSMTRVPEAVVVCGNDISIPHLCFGAFYKSPTTTSAKKELFEAPHVRSSRDIDVNISITEITKDKLLPTRPRDLL